jgi:hypothetical protein
MKFCENDSIGHIPNASFSSQLMKGPKKLECYITQDLKGLLVINTQVYGGPFIVAKKIRYNE